MKSTENQPYLLKISFQVHYWNIYEIFPFLCRQVTPENHNTEQYYTVHKQEDQKQTNFIKNLRTKDMHYHWQVYNASKNFWHVSLKQNVMGYLHGSLLIAVKPEGNHWFWTNFTSLFCILQKMSLMKVPNFSRIKEIWNVKILYYLNLTPSGIPRMT